MENAKEFVAKVFELDHEGEEEFAKAKAEALGIKLGDFMTLTTRERGCFITFL